MVQLRSSKVAVQIAHKIELSILRVSFTNKRFKISKDLNWRVRRSIPGYHEKKLWSRFSDFYTKIFELDDVVFVTCGIVDVSVELGSCGLGRHAWTRWFPERVCQQYMTAPSVHRSAWYACLPIIPWKLWEQNRFKAECRILRGLPWMTFLVSSSVFLVIL